MTLLEVAEQVGLIAGILIGLAIIGRAVLSTGKLIRSIVDVIGKLEEIYEQFQPNHGHSLNDRVVRIDENVRTNARNIETIYTVVLKGHDFDPADAPLLETLDCEPDV